MKRGTEHQPFEDDQGLLVAYYAALKIEEKNKRPEENCICQILTTSKHLRRTNVDTRYNIISKLPANKIPYSLG